MAMASNLVVITAFSDTSDFQPWGFKYLQNLLRRSVDSIICHSCPSSLPRLALLRRMGGASGSCLSWTVEGSRPGILRRKWGPNPWDLSRSMKITKGGRFYGSLIPKAVFWKAFWCPTVPTSSECQKTHVELGTLNLPTSLHVEHTAVRDPAPMLCISRSEAERSGSKLPSVLISLQVYYPPNRSTNLVQLFGVGFLSYLF